MGHTIRPDHRRDPIPVCTMKQDNLELKDEMIAEHKKYNLNRSDFCPFFKDKNYSECRWAKE